MMGEAKASKVALRNVHLLSFVLCWGPLQGKTNTGQDSGVQDI